jgi:SAM-dependent methyltransferase
VITDERDSPRYWEARAQPYLETADEWRAVSVEGAVARPHVRFEARGVLEVERCLPRGGRVLDAGCGVGRWFARTSPGRSLVGMDFTPSLVERARAVGKGVEVFVGDVRDIPADSSSFDAAYTVKVIQCLRETDRPRAVAELLRVTRPGGVVVLFEKTRGADGSRPAAWRAWGEQAGGRLVAWHPNGFAVLLRPLGWLARLSRRLRRSTDADAAAPARRSGRRAAYVRAQALALRASLPLESLAERVLPRQWAEHGIFVFRK